MKTDSSVTMTMKFQATLPSNFRVEAPAIELHMPLRTCRLNGVLVKYETLITVRDLWRKYLGAIDVDGYPSDLRIRGEDFTVELSSFRSADGVVCRFNDKTNAVYFGDQKLLGRLGIHNTCQGSIHGGKGLVDYLCETIDAVEEAVNSEVSKLATEKS